MEPGLPHNYKMNFYHKKYFFLNTYISQKKISTSKKLFIFENKKKWVEKNLKKFIFLLGSIL